ncbi:hypothetical protein AAV97_17170 [Acinetobacter sp. Ag2]|uniref:hypothetical protein n=1 Tax=Acinetobacter sp. Ag2 TaxID=1646532 RepID=UPI000628FCA9|nr:hypothetical protein [Acinetobacter sp. Ag2]KKW76127.1 hypothetical protein AAV97_17170 [Acinetobacter sp. Ag2]
MTTVVIEQPKLDVLASTRLPSNWNEVIENNSVNRSDWIREAIKQRLIAENLIALGESNFSHKSDRKQTYTLNTSYTTMNSNVFKNVFRIFKKQLAQKKPEVASQTFPAHSSQG